MVKFLRRAWYAMRQRRLDAELAEEMDFHRAMKRDELERSGLRGRRCGICQPAGAGQSDACSRGRSCRLDLAVDR